MRSAAGSIPGFSCISALVVVRYFWAIEPSVSPLWIT